MKNFRLKKKRYNWFFSELK